MEALPHLLPDILLAFPQPLQSNTRQWHHVFGRAKDMNKPLFFLATAPTPFLGIDYGRVASILTTPLPSCPSQLSLSFRSIFLALTFTFLSALSPRQPDLGAI